MLESDADRLEALKGLGELLTVDGADVWAVFEKDYFDALSDPGVGSASPQLTARSIDLKYVVRDSIVKRANGETYRVRQPEPDGTGMTLVSLRSG